MLFQLKTVHAIVLGVSAVGLAFVGYAVYFDYKRRSTVGYKETIRLKRQFRSQQSVDAMNFLIDYPDMQQFFLQEIQVGEEKLLLGFVHQGIGHFANAIIMCNKPEQVMGIFRRTLAEEHYSLLEKSVPEARKKFAHLVRCAGISKSSCIN